jgi:hypothetical protein
MSTYYTILDKKLRISDHQPNTKINGSNDIYFWTNDACGSPLSIGAQIDKYCEKNDIEITVFQKVITDFSDLDEECMYMKIEIERNNGQK